MLFSVKTSFYQSIANYRTKKGWTHAPWIHLCIRSYMPYLHVASSTIAHVNSMHRYNRLTCWYKHSIKVLKNRQHSVQKKKRTNNELQKTTQKTKNGATRTHYKPGGGGGGGETQVCLLLIRDLTK